MALLQDFLSTLEATFYRNLTIVMKVLKLTICHCCSTISIRRGCYNDVNMIIRDGSSFSCIFCQYLHFTFFLQSLLNSFIFFILYLTLFQILIKYLDYVSPRLRLLFYITYIHHYEYLILF